MRCSSKKHPVKKADKLMKLSYKHLVSSKNCHALDFKCTSAENEDFDPEE